MSKFLPLANIDQDIRRHLELGGSTDDKVGQELITNYVISALKIEEIQKLAAIYNLSSRDLAEIFTTSINSLLPNPCIKSGIFPMIAGSLLFREPIRLQNVLTMSFRSIPPDASDSQRRASMLHSTELVMREVWNTHTRERGEARFTVTPGGSGLPANWGKGCMGLLFIGFTMLCSILALSCLMLA